MHDIVNSLTFLERPIILGVLSHWNVPGEIVKGVLDAGGMLIGVFV